MFNGGHGQANSHPYLRHALSTTAEGERTPLLHLEGEWDSNTTCSVATLGTVTNTNSLAKRGVARSLETH